MLREDDWDLDAGGGNQGYRSQYKNIWGRMCNEDGPQGGDRER